MLLEDLTSEDRVHIFRYLLEEAHSRYSGFGTCEPLARGDHRFASSNERLPLLSLNGLKTAFECLSLIAGDDRRKRFRFLAVYVGESIVSADWLTHMNYLGRDSGRHSRVNNLKPLLGPNSAHFSRVWSRSSQGYINIPPCISGSRHRYVTPKGHSRWRHGKCNSEWEHTLNIGFMSRYVTQTVILPGSLIGDTLDTLAAYIPICNMFFNNVQSYITVQPR